jgi:hypothetical protein
MLQPSRGFYGAVAIALTMGAVPLAAGRDLAGGAQLLMATTATFGAAPEVMNRPTGINREAKADRSAAAPRAGLPTHTISLQVNGLADTSVLVRIPTAAGARREPAPSLIKPASGMAAVACEPVVSVLTDVARLLEPGKCVT